MEKIIIKANGDLDEYYRVDKFMRFVFKDDNPYRFIDCDPNLIRGYTRDDDPILNMPWSKATTKELRRKFLNKIIDAPTTNASFGNITPYPYKYVLALYEDELNDIYDMAAVIIQKHAKGVLTRNKQGVHNPHCDIGKIFVRNMFHRLLETF